MRTRRIFLLFLGLGLATIVVFALERNSRLGDPASDMDAGVRLACGSCHLFPPPTVLPRAAWRAQVEHMAFLIDYLPSDFSDLDFDVDDFVAWFENRAPERLEMDPPITSDGPAPLVFERRSLRLGRESGPGVATVGRIGSSLSVPNMARGSVHVLSRTAGPRLIGNAGHPARISAGDLDGNGMEDLVIADLGDSSPTDDPVGRVLVALQREDAQFEIQPLVTSIGRVSDVRPIDLDRDGDLDLVVAAFGYLQKGGVYVLRNESVAGALDFRLERISDRTGAVAVVPVDGLVPGAGPGFVVAFAQEHEMVSAFLPGAPSGYEEHILFRAPHPAWGTSHLAAADLDADGDLDFLLSNGDTLDDGVAIKPYHGVTWLENRGEGPFQPHPIGRLYGAHAAEAGDLDGDGDLDVVASGFLPQIKLPVPQNSIRLDSVVWFERDGSEWIPWAIESDHPRHTGLTLTDFDEDGRLDIVAAINRAWDITTVETGPSLEVWFNRRRR